MAATVPPEAAGPQPPSPPPGAPVLRDAAGPDAATGPQRCHGGGSGRGHRPGRRPTQPSGARHRGRPRAGAVARRLRPLRRPRPAAGADHVRPAPGPAVDHALRPRRPPGVAGHLLSGPRPRHRVGAGLPRRLPADALRRVDGHHRGGRHQTGRRHQVERGPGPAGRGRRPGRAVRRQVRSASTGTSSSAAAPAAGGTSSCSCSRPPGRPSPRR